MALVPVLAETDERGVAAEQADRDLARLRPVKDEAGFARREAVVELVVDLLAGILVFQVADLLEDDGPLLCVDLAYFQDADVGRILDELAEGWRGVDVGQR